VVAALHHRELNSLIDRAIAGSPTLEIALDRLRQARAQEVVVIGAALPTVGGTEGDGWGTGADRALQIARRGWEDYQIFPPIPPPLPAIAAAFKRLLTPEAVP
jgi:outer membrane protein TolC